MRSCKIPLFQLHYGKTKSRPGRTAEGIFCHDCIFNERSDDGARRGVLRRKRAGGRASRSAPGARAPRAARHLRPADRERTAHMAAELRATLEKSGYAVERFDSLDGANDADAPALVAAADLILLAGGHVPTQNAYFQRIGLRGLLSRFSGVLIGISAGSMNSAETVYAQPELPGESTDAAFRRYLPGLGLTKKQIIRTIRRSGTSCSTESGFLRTSPTRTATPRIFRHPRRQLPPRRPRRRAVLRRSLAHRRRRLRENTIKKDRTAAKRCRPMPFYHFSKCTSVSS